MARMTRAMGAQPGPTVFPSRAGVHEPGEESVGHLSLLKAHVSGAQLGQQRMLVDELEPCCLLTHRK